jgi:hypothetical protein
VGHHLRHEELKGADSGLPAHAGLLHAKEEVADAEAAEALNGGDAVVRIPEDEAVSDQILVVK